MRPIAASIVVGVLLTACGDGPSAAVRPGPTQSHGDVDLAGGWVLESGTVGDQQVPLLEDHRITAVVEGDQLSGTAACNLYGATLKITGDAVALRDLAGTAMACAPRVMRSEELYLKALRSVDAAGRDGETLVLSGPGTSLRFNALSPAPVADVAGTVWVLTTLVNGDVATSVGGDRATLELSADGRLSGSTGCRALHGR